MFPRHLSSTLYDVLRRTGAAFVFRRFGAVVFCYHNVVPDELNGRIGEGWLHIGISEFREQIAWIAKAYTVVPLSELLRRLQRGRGVGGLAALTFDDGYLGLLRHGLPVLRAAGLPFTLFPVTSTATEPRHFWWDRLGPLHARERQHLVGELQGDAELIGAQTALPTEVAEDALPASWSELRSVLGADCEVGVHTVTHRNLTPLPAEEIAWELTHARACVEREIGARAVSVAYPYGAVNEAVFAQMKKHGFEAGLGLEFGSVHGGTDPYNIPRVNVPAGIRMSNFACWGSGLKLRF